MIPSDHFIYFYNETFKFIAEQGARELDRYYSRVADRQAFFVLDTFRREGLEGMFRYWNRIRIEENCDMDMTLTDDCLFQHMNKCPSLTKALDSDAGPCAVYCDHCPGWVMKVLSRAGYWGVMDLLDRTKPVCDTWIFADRQLARRKYEERIALHGKELVKTNLDVIPPFLANNIADSARFEFMNPHFGRAFEFLRKTDLAALPVGKVAIDGDDVFAFVSAPELKPFAERDFEVHRKYIDIHTPIVGDETFGSFTMTEKELALPFDEKDDSAVFKAKSDPITIRKGEFVAYFPPYGAHAPATYLGTEPPRSFR